MTDHRACRRKGSPDDLGRGDSDTAAPNFGRRKQMASSSQQSTGTNTYVEVVPLTLHIGAEICGVDLSKPLPPEQVKEVRDAFLKWKVVFFRGQNRRGLPRRHLARSFCRRGRQPSPAETV